MHEIEWYTTTELVPYAAAVEWMEARVDAIQHGTAPECVWCLEHPPLYSAGVSSKMTDLLDAELPVFTTNRGGQLTYHGPGQRVAYVLLKLSADEQDLHAYVAKLESWVINTLQHFNIHGVRAPGRIGIWVETPSEAKIAAIGVRVRKWVTYHGIAINLAPNLAHFSGIVPCGISEYGVTSMAALGITPSMAELDTILQSEFTKVFARGIAHGRPSSPPAFKS